ncbi:hypothetical protein STCU_11677 [Strigomonas culicis]|uniref:Uncharacterized protein n=1 Tax=Strigomonas culicis TaxID=28005 RepID=S9TG31_9TRYP|nr:hypothetical protein STCU_11677 [Strigomonas culicis]|eukprot:EPY15914.1 hypothetical protein STCU_11677 [Strigomonas culicis]
MATRLLSRLWLEPELSVAELSVRSCVAAIMSRSLKDIFLGAVNNLNIRIVVEKENKENTESRFIVIDISKINNKDNNSTYI